MKMLAREVHDNIGSHLTSIKINLENLISVMEKNSATPEAAKELISLVQQSIRECGRIMTDLRPSILDDYDMAATVGWLSDQFQRMYPGIEIRKEIDIKEDELSEHQKIVVFRVIQEALNNIAKHSGAKRVGISLTADGGAVELAIEDDGVGFDRYMAVANDCEKGFGLTSMRERVVLTGGTFLIESSRGKGTTISASWPRKR